MNIIVYENGPFMVNTYLIVNEDSGEGFILDPGSDIEMLINKIEEDTLNLKAIVCTHGHIDHVAGAKKVQDKFHVPLYLNDMEKDIVEAISFQAGMFGVPDPGVPSIDENLPTSGELEVAGIKFSLLHTPGHSPGSISLYSGDVLFSGDSLFNMSIGRTDLPGGSYDTLISAIKEKLFALPDETRVLCGHGPETTISVEKRMNPFL